MGTPKREHTALVDRGRTFRSSRNLLIRFRLVVKCHEGHVLLRARILFFSEEDCCSKTSRHISPRLGLGPTLLPALGPAGRAREPPSVQLHFSGAGVLHSKAPFSSALPPGSRFPPFQFAAPNPGLLGPPSFLRLTEPKTAGAARGGGSS